MRNRTILLAMKSAAAGDVESAKSLLNLMASSIEGVRDPLPEFAAKWLALALREIAQGKDANAALMVKRRAGRQQKFTREMWFRMDDLIRNGESDDSAADIVANELAEKGIEISTRSLTMNYAEEPPPPAVRFQKK